jgi:replicative DNA helicase
MTDRIASIAQIEALVRLARERHDVKLVVVDYLQLIRGPRGVTDKRLEVEAVSGQLKTLAQEHKIVVIALSAMSRRERGAGGRRPTIADLRETGRLEHDADVILLGWRPDNTSRETELIIAKGRGVKTGTVELLFFGDTLTFREKSTRDPGEDEVPF